MTSDGKKIEDEDENEDEDEEQKAATGTETALTPALSPRRGGRCRTAIVLWKITSRPLVQGFYARLLSKTKAVNPGNAYFLVRLDFL